MRGDGPIWILAHKQTAARGRRGRSWVMDAGNFAGSYLCYPDKPLADLSQMSFVAALALADTMQRMAGISAKLKWPNDLLVGGRKISGILLETVQHEGRTGLIVGMGLNLVSAPERDALDTHALDAISLYAETGQKIPPEDFLVPLAVAVSEWQGRWQANGFSPIREAWLARAAGLGDRMTARLPGATHHGTFEDIDASGALVLRTSQSRLVLPAADVYFGADPGV